MKWLRYSLNHLIYGWEWRWCKLMMILYCLVTTYQASTYSVWNVMVLVSLSLTIKRINYTIHLAIHQYTVSSIISFLPVLSCSFSRCSFSNFSRSFLFKCFKLCKGDQSSAVIGGNFFGIVRRSVKDRRSHSSNGAPINATMKYWNVN